MSYYDCDETDFAVERYHRAYPQGAIPNRHQTGVEGDKIVLRTGDRILATYSFHDVAKDLEAQAERRVH